MLKIWQTCDRQCGNERSFWVWRGFKVALSSFSFREESLLWPSKERLRCTLNSSSTWDKPTARSSTSPSRRRPEEEEEEEHQGDGHQEDEQQAPAGGRRTETVGLLTWSAGQTLSPHLLTPHPSHPPLECLPSLTPHIFKPLSWRQTAAC